MPDRRDPSRETFDAEDVLRQTRRPEGPLPGYPSSFVVVGSVAPSKNAAIRSCWRRASR
jgi:hypothetical protein